MKKIYHWICEAEKVIAMTGIVLMTIFIFLGAVSRAVGHPCLHDLLWRKADVFISIPHV